MKRSAKTPLWQFSGLVLILLAVVYGIYANENEKAREFAYILDPLPGDIYEYKTETNNYSTLKVSDVTEHSITFFYNEYETNLTSGIGDIERASNYSEEKHTMPRIEIENMFKKGIIYDISRE